MLRFPLTFIGPLRSLESITPITTYVLFGFFSHRAISGLIFDISAFLGPNSSDLRDESLALIYWQVRMFTTSHIHPKVSSRGHLPPHMVSAIH